jgi:ELWxxDGT repeat protein
VGNDGTHGNELWATDGTAAGTAMVSDIRPGAAGSNPSQITNMKGAVLFAANDGSNGRELWRSDGTGSGTFLVKDIRPGASSSSPDHFTNVKGIIFFSADDGTNGIELWKSTGTTTNTLLVKDINAGPASSNPNYLTNVKGNVFFAASDGVTGNELWKSNGSAAGTVLLKDIATGAYGFYSSDPHNLINLNGTLMFAANDVVHGVEMWRSNASTTGTVLVKDLAPGLTGSYPALLTNLNSKLFFRASNASTGQELWTSSIFGNTMSQVSDINPGLASSEIEWIAVAGSTLFFGANDGVNARELWTLSSPTSSPIQSLLRTDNSTRFDASSTSLTFLGRSPIAGDNSNGSAKERQFAAIPRRFGSRFRRQELGHRDSVPEHLTQHLDRLVYNLIWTDPNKATIGQNHRLARNPGKLSPDTDGELFFYFLEM